jgi:hypothetical protein
MMTKRVLLLLMVFLLLPLAAQAQESGKAVESAGLLSGQVVNDVGIPLPGGIVSFFFIEKGSPMVGKTHRLPDMVGRMGIDGRFTTKLAEGTYYIGALVITDPGRGPGPPRQGELFYFIKDAEGNLQEFTVTANEAKDVGQLAGVMPKELFVEKEMITVEGRLLIEDGKPFAGGIVLAKSDMNSRRPDFVSERTGADGRYQLKLPAGVDYYLVSRERVIGRPTPGTYVGVYGSNSSIIEGGALPIGNVQPPSQPAGAMLRQKPQQKDKTEIRPGNQLPNVIKGTPGQTISNVDIVMFKVPDPNAQREALQGTLGFETEEQKQEAGVPKPAAPKTEKMK